MLDVLVKFSEMAQRLEGMQTLNRISQILYMGILLFGLLNALLGYRLLRFWVMLGGFAVGAVVGGVAAHHFQMDDYMIIGCAAAGAIILAAVAFLIYKAGIFILCASIGWGAGIYLVHPTTSLSFFLCILFGVGLGVLGVRFAKPVIIAGTSVQGGMTAGLAAAQLLEWKRVPYGFIAGIAIAGLGILIQTITNRSSYEQEEDYDYEDPQYRVRPQDEYEEEWESQEERPLYQRGEYNDNRNFEPDRRTGRMRRHEFYEEEERR